MGSAITLDRNDYTEALEKIEQVSAETSYVDQFKFEFPEGLNTASTMEICRAVQDAGFESKVRLARVCITGKPVKATCPNGEVEKFQLSETNAGLEGFPLFQKEPFALMALADTIYGYILKKSLRPSKPKKEPQAAAEE